jgi:hypothetical protein
MESPHHGPHDSGRNGRSKFAEQELSVSLIKGLFFIFGFTFSIQAQAGLDVSFWSYRYLARASNVLLVASDQYLAKQKIICGINGPSVSKLSQSLKALVDEKIKTLSSAQVAAIRSQVATCQADCSCDLIAYVLEPRSSPADRDAVTLLQTNSKPISSSDRLKCAQNFFQFCQSQLLKKISQ